MSNRCCVSRWCTVQQVPFFTVMQCPTVTVFHYDSLSSRCCSLLCYNVQKMLGFFRFFFTVMHCCTGATFHDDTVTVFTVIQCPVGAQQMLFLTVMQGLTVAVFDCYAMSSSWCVSLWCNAMVYGDAMSNRRTVLTTAARCQQPYALGGPCALLGYPQSLLSNICLHVSLPTCVSA